MKKLILLFMISLTITSVFAQPGAKEDGEMEQIEKRLEWFLQQRGLQNIVRPDLLRAAAVEDLRTSRNQVESLATSDWSEMGPSPMNMLSWQMGKVAGRVDAIAVVPGDSSTLYLGAAAGGLWKTTDGGNSWTSLFDDIGTLTIGSIYIEPGNTDHVWVGTGEHQAYCSKYFGLGLFKSEDAGQTFTAVNGSGSSALKLSFIAGVAVSRSNPQIVIAGGDGYCEGSSSYAGGLFVSTDGGTSWTRKISHNITEVVMHPTDNNTFYAAVVSSSSSDGVWKSTDSGATWVKTSTGLPASFSRLRLVNSLSSPETLYALIYPSGSGSSLYKTTNGGTNWSLQNSNACEGQCSYNQCLAIHPTNPATLIVGSIRFAKTTNSGSSLNYLTSGWGSFQKVHQDTHVLVYDPANGNRFWVGGDGGIWRTDDGGSNFVNLNSDLNITQFYDIAVDPVNPKNILGGAQDNSSSMTKGNKVWEVTIVTGDGFMNLVDPLNPDILYQTSYPSGGLPSLVRSSNGGTWWTWLSGSGLGSGEPWPWVTPLAISSNPAGDHTHVFIGSNRIYRSDNNGSNWTALSASALSGSSFAVIVPHLEGGKLELYAGSSNGIWKTDDALAATVSWDNITNNYSAGYVTDIAVTPNDHKWIFVTTGRFGTQNQLFRSGDQGASWTAVGSGIPNIPANTVAVDPLNVLRIFVGTDIGVYISEDRGETFVPMMNGMPLGNVVTDLEIDDSPHTLTAGTYGRGAWQADLQFDPLTVNAGMDQSTCRNDTISLTAAGNNGTPGYTWSWSITAGPDTSPGQFNHEDMQTTLFTPSLAGEYTIQIEINDSASQTATDVLTVVAGDKTVFAVEIQRRWPLPDTSSKDRNGNGRIDLIDMLIQDINPICL